MMKKLIAVFFTVVMCICTLPSVSFADEIYTYDVSICHIIINQAYTNNKGAYASHGFIELYNPSDEDVDITGWSLHYMSSQEGNCPDSWSELTLSGTIKAHTSFLVRCAACGEPNDSAIQISSFDQEWDQNIYSKGYSIVLTNSDVTINSSDGIFDNETKTPLVDNYVDMYAVSGNDETEEQKAPFFETEASAVASKKKTVRRKTFQDTDNNSTDGDMEVVDYSSDSADYIASVKPRSSADGTWGISEGGENDDETEELPVVPQVYISTVYDNGNFIEKSTGYVPTTITIVDTDGTVLEDSNGQIKVRGNSTAEAEKKPFNIKFSSKQNVLGMGKAKKWCLLANCFDVTLMRNGIALDLAQAMEIPYTSEYRIVELWVDDVYKGCYQLTEAVEASSSRVDIDTDSGDFMLELNAGRVEDDVTYISTDTGIRFEFSEPEEPTSAQYANVQVVLNRFTYALNSGDFSAVSEICDIDSFAKMYVLLEYLKPIDVPSYSVNIYYKSGKLYAGPPWDFDLSTGNGNSSYYSQTSLIYYDYYANVHFFKTLLQYDEFYQCVYDTFKKYESVISNVSGENGLIDSYMDKYESIYSKNYSDAGWNVSSRYSYLEAHREDTFEANVEKLRTWLNNRYIWLSQKAWASRDYCLMVGDANCDGSFDARDYILVKNYLLGKSEISTAKGLLEADVNGDSTVDPRDYVRIRNKLLGK